MAFHSSGEAYDFDLFREKTSKPQPALELIENSKYKKRDRMTSLRIVSTAAVVVAVICVMLYSRAQLTELSSDLGKMNNEHQLLQSEYTRLCAEMEGKVSLRGVEERAKELGLSKVQSYQVEYISIEKSENFATSGVKPQELSLLDKLSLSMGSFLEYIKFW